MESVFLAESAVLVHLQTLRSVFLVFELVVVPLLALCACQNNFCLHFAAPPVLRKKFFVDTLLYRLSPTSKK